MGNMVVGIAVFLFGFGLFFLLSLVLVQVFGIDTDGVKYKTGKLTLPTKKQLKCALIATIAVGVIIGLYALLTK